MHTTDIKNIGGKQSLLYTINTSLILFLYT